MTNLKMNNLIYLLDEQEKLDGSILKERGLTRKETRKYREVAFLVEASEFANDTQYFKYWKVNNEAKETMLEEFVDALHFGLSLALDMNLKREDTSRMIMSHYEKAVVRNEKLDLNDLVITLYQLPSTTQIRDSHLYLSNLLVIAARFGFTEAQILEAYKVKNNVNYERLENAY